MLLVTVLLPVRHRWWHRTPVAIPRRRIVSAGTGGGRRGTRARSRGCGCGLVEPERRQRRDEGSFQLAVEGLVGDAVDHAAGGTFVAVAAAAAAAATLPLDLLVPCDQDLVWTSVWRARWVWCRGPGSAAWRDNITQRGKV